MRIAVVGAGDHRRQLRVRTRRRRPRGSRCSERHGSFSRRVRQRRHRRAGLHRHAVDCAGHAAQVLAHLFSAPPGAREPAPGGAAAAMAVALVARLPDHLPGQPDARQRLAMFSRDRLHALTRELGRPGILAAAGLSSCCGARGDLAAARQAGAAEGTRRLPSSGSTRGLPPIRTQPESSRRCVPGSTACARRVANCRQFALLLPDRKRLGGASIPRRRGPPRIAPVLVHQRLPPEPSLTGRADPSPRSGHHPDGGPPSGRRSTRSWSARPRRRRCTSLHMGSSCRCWRCGYSIRRAAAPLLEEFPGFGPRAAALVDERTRSRSMPALATRCGLPGVPGWSGSLAVQQPDALATLAKGARRLVPQARRGWIRTRPRRWKVARPPLPDGPPVLGAKQHRRVCWLALGHGSSGWALPPGSARHRADDRRTPPPIDTEGHTVACGSERFSHNPGSAPRHTVRPPPAS